MIAFPQLTLSGAASTARPPDRLPALDGWRGISILLVLAAHLLPLGPKAWKLNQMAGPLGMALFFTLSGFLIANFLLRHEGIAEFLLRRIFRIVPLAWLGLLVALPMAGTAVDDYLPNFLFVANWPPVSLGEASLHFWSLCVEMQFYLGVAVLCLLLGSRGLLLVPLLCLAVTVARIDQVEHASIVTWFRLDEILAGSVLALAWSGRLGGRLPVLIGRANPWVLLVLLLVSSHPDGGAMNYLRPYLAALLVGSTILHPARPLAPLLGHPVLAYLAAISYALYVIHPLLAHSWLGSGESIEKYLKRPLLLAALFLLAHLSTFHFERHCMALGRRLAARWRSRT